MGYLSSWNGGGHCGEILKDMVGMVYLPLGQGRPTPATSASSNRRCQCLLDPGGCCHHSNLRGSSTDGTGGLTHLSLQTAHMQS